MEFRNLPRFATNNILLLAMFFFWCIISTVLLYNGLSMQTSDTSSLRQGTKFAMVDNSVTSGVVFKGKIIRQIPPSKRITFSNARSSIEESSSICEKWAVVTTIFAPSEAIRRIIRMKNWCVVIVADGKSLSKVDYTKDWIDNANNWSPFVKYLTLLDQHQMKSSFVDSMPMNSFARKNIGYLYALQQGARYIWDFDDDNQLNYWSSSIETFDATAASAADAAIASAQAIQTLDKLVDLLQNLKDNQHKLMLIDPNSIISDQMPTVINPYPLLGCPNEPCWPRGFPLEYIRDESTNQFTVIKANSRKHQQNSNSSSYSRGNNAPDASDSKQPKEGQNVVTDESSSIGVIDDIGIVQSLGDHQPDVDAIYRLTQPTPFKFDPYQSKIPVTNLFVSPKKSFVPLNAQATLHTYNALWGLLLPSTVPGRVADIWRSYLTTRVMSDTNSRIAFAGSALVVQDRNDHTNMGDFVAETKLYQQTNALIEFLNNWQWPVELTTDRTVAYELLYNSHVTSSTQAGQLNDQVVPPIVIEMRELWIAAYERGFIEIEDIDRVQLWLQALIDARYQFPPLLKPQKEPKASRAFPPTSVVKTLSPTSAKPRKRNKCANNVPDLTFFFSDLHDGTRIDLSSTLSALGFTIILGGLKQKLTPWPDNPELEKFELLTDISEVLYDHNLHTKSLHVDEIRSNYNFYQYNPTIAAVDVFVCSFPASMCELWIPFNKTILFNPAHRYNIGRCSVDEWELLHKHVHQWGNSNSNSNSMRGLVGAMSLYDEEYMRYYLGPDIKIHQLYSSGMSYLQPYSFVPITPKRSEVPVLCTTNDNDYMMQVIRYIPTAVDIRQLYPRYTAEDLRNHRAVIYIPLSVMSYKLTDLYALCVPIVVPSPMMAYNNVNDDRDPYCPLEFTALLPPHKENIHPYSPVATDIASSLYWYQYSDMMTWPHILIYESYEHLESILFTTDFSLVSKRMAVENKKRQKKLEHAVCQSLEGVEKGRKLPTEFTYN